MRVWERVLAAGLGLLASAAVARADPRALDRAVDAAGAAGLAGEIVVTDGEHTFLHRALSAPGRPHRVGETWRWASVTKQLTATLVMQEVAAGRLSLDDTLAARLPAFKGPTAARVTVRMLLQHTSGLPNPDDTRAETDKAFPDFYRRTSAGVGGPADALGYCAGAPKGAPGARFAYDNCDYIVLGAVLARSAGRPYATLVRERLARPLGLSSLRVATTPGASPRLVSGVMEGGAPEPPFTLATFGPAGAAYGRAEDLARFDRGLLAGRLLDPAAREEAWRGDPKLGYVALGVWGFPAPLKGCHGAVQLVERRGEIGGVEVRNLLAPELHRALIVFADRADLPFGEIWQGRGLTYDLASAAFCPAALTA